MKNLFTFLFISASLLVSTLSFGQSPEKFSYQAVIRDANNALIQNQGVGIRVSILQGSATGNPEYVETQSPSTNANGLVTVEIGSGSVVSGDISTIDWTNGPFFIKTEIDPSGGSNYTISGASEMLSVPFALHATTADNILGGINETDPIFTASPANGITSGDITSWDNKLDTEVDGSVTNELQTISKSGNTVTLSNSGGSFTDAVNDADHSVTNEIQTLSLSGQVITLSNGGGSVTIPSSNGWNTTGNSGTTPGTNFIGTTDNKAIIFKANNAYVGKIAPGNGDVFLGNDAGNGSTSNTANYNVGIGSGSMGSISSSAYYNTAVGYQTLNSLTTGDYNTAVGTETMKLTTTGGYNAAFGRGTLGTNVSGQYNAGSGYRALNNNTTGSNNTALGASAMYKNTTASGNVAIGYYSSYNNLTGTQNTACGYEALRLNTSNYNSAFGYQALRGNTSGIYNTAIGHNSLKALTTGNYNTAVGYRSLFKATTSSDNSSFGEFSLYNTTTGYKNTGIGSEALMGNISGYYNVAVGFSTFSLGSSYHNSAAIGYNAEPGANNRVRLGNSAVSSIGGYANWTNASDGRLKTNVKEDIVGLDFIMKLRPVSYNLDMDAIAKMNNTPDSLRLPEDEALKAAEIQTGFIAQEVETAANQTGFAFHGVEAPKNANDHYGLRYAEFVVPLVKGMQEQQKTIKNLEAQNAELKHALELLMKRVEKLEKK